MTYEPLRRRATVLDAYLRFIESGIQPFTVPGHKRRGALLDEGLGIATAGDVPFYGGIDEIKLTNRVLVDAEARAAELYEADWCRFSTGGSTHANQALCLAIGRPGDSVIVSRTLHRSTLLGLVLAGLEPVWLPPRIDPDTGYSVGTLVADVVDALHRAPTAVAVLLTEPGYVGTIGELAGAIAAAHRRDIPVIVDQAWGAHLGFHPALPDHALALGADAMVTSIHKLLPGYSQASLLVARTDRLDRERLNRGFDATHTTSPAGSILASIDGSLALMEQRGESLLGETLSLVTRARSRLQAEVPGILVPDESHFGLNRFDPIRLIVSLAPTGASGIEVERLLLAEGFPVEMADRDTVIPVVTVADTAAGVTAMTDALVRAVNRSRGTPRPLNGAVSWRILADTVISPREAFFAEHEHVTAEQAVGRVSAELVAPYPPGIPVLAPGERITTDLLEALQQAARESVRIAYASDPTLATFDVLVQQRKD